MTSFTRVLAAVRSVLGPHFLRYRLAWSALLVALVILAALYLGYAAAPASFPTDSIVVIPQGASAAEVAQSLADEHVVRSAPVLRVVLRLTGASAHIHPGAYRLTAPENVFRISERVGSGAFGIPPTRITFLEGDTVRDMAAKVAAAFPAITASDFISVAGPEEGYLFPDTYLFPPDATPESIVAAMHKNFDEKLAPLEADIAASGHSESDIVTMASLIEKEGRSLESKTMISGILWNRIQKGMPLQVDAVFGYIFGRDTYSPSLADLGVDSPYNTYTHTGLPPGPIDNPGLDSLTAAIHPAKTNYLFYLTGKDGQMHYATTYAEQLANERVYLR